MILTRKIIAGSVLGTGLIAGYSYVKKLKKMQSELVVVPKASLYRMNLDGLVIRVDAVLKNPTKGSFSLKFPFIKILYKDAVVGSSEVVNQEIKIPKYGEAKIEKILIAVPLLNLFSMVSSLAKAIQNNEKVRLKIQVMTEVNPGWMKLPYESIQEVVLAT